jgi:hypothetical protein
MLVIHTKPSGEITESNNWKSKDELETLRKECKEIDDFYNSKYKPVVFAVVLHGRNAQRIEDCFKE